MQRLKNMSLFLPLLLVACSNEPAPTAPADMPDAAREYEAADKAIARKLSVANRSGIENASSPYQLTLLCQIGLVSLSERVGSLGGNMTDGIGKARELYAAQSKQLGAQLGKSEIEVSEELSQLTEDNTDADTNARVALACIKKLSEQIKSQGLKS